MEIRLGPLARQDGILGEQFSIDINLNVDCVEFQNLLPSTEHFVKVIYDILKPILGPDYQLHITLIETAKNAAEYGDW